MHGAPNHGNTPGLQLHQLRRAHVHVIAEDFWEIPLGVVQRYLGELLQWRLDDELSPTALAIVAVLSLYRGLRGGERGCGVQASIEAWAKLLGRSERMVAYAFAQLAERGWVLRHRRLVDVKWTHKWIDARGIERTRVHQRADIYAVAYLSGEGYRRISRRGELKRAVVKDGKRRLVLYAAGIVGRLLKTLAGNLRVVARRVAAVQNRCTPSFGVETREAKEQKQRSSPVGSASGQSSSVGPERFKVPGTGPPDAGTGGDELELLQLFERGALTPQNAWPELWERAHTPYTDERGHFREYNNDSRKWLQRSAERWIARFSKRELEQLVASRAIRA